MGKPLIDCRVPGGIIGDQFRRVSLYKHQLLQRVADQNPDLAASIRNMKLDWYAIRPVAQIDEMRTGTLRLIFQSDRPPVPFYNCSG